MADNPPLPPGYYYYNGKIYSENGGGPWDGNSPEGQKIMAAGASSSGSGSPSNLAADEVSNLQGDDQNAPNYSVEMGREKWLKTQAAEAAAQEKAKQDAIAAQKAANNKFNYGGREGAASTDADYFHRAAQGAQNRQGEQIDLSGANGWEQNGMLSRERQVGIADLMAKRARGETPSIAGMRADQDIRTLTAGQTSAAASARGPAAMALAQQNAANNTAQGTSMISNQAQINTAQERSDAEKSAFAAYSGVRGGDQASQQIDFNQAKSQAEINAAQRARNDAYSLGLYNNEIDVNKAQLGAQGNQVAIATGAAQAQAARDQAAGFHSDDRLDKYIGIGAGVLGASLPVVLPALLPSMGGGSSNSSPASSPDGRGFGAPASGGVGDTPDWLDQNYAGGSSGNEGLDPYSSDERIKNGINPEDSRGNRVDAFLNGIHPLSFRYNDPAQEPRGEPTGGRYLGISAQDLEAIPEIGPQLVSEGPRGKRVEANATLSAALAGLARLHERVKDIESGTAAQRDGMMAQGPAVRERPRISDAEARRLMDRAGEIQDRTAAQHALLGVDTITSDMRAKNDVVRESDPASLLAARRAAFADGLAHANEAADTGRFPQPPEYIEKSPDFHDPEQLRRSSVVHRQPDGEAGNVHSKRSGAYVRQDAAAQNAYNDAVTQARREAAIAENFPPVLGPVSMGTTLAGYSQIGKLDKANESRKPKTFTPYTPSRFERARDGFVRAGESVERGMRDTLGNFYPATDYQPSEEAETLATVDPRYSGGR